MSTAPRCRTLSVLTFRGDRSAMAQRVLRQLDDERNGRGPGPAAADCLLYVGHTGVSTDSGTTIFGFHPDTGNFPMWQAMRRLRNGGAFPGVVHDDTQVFATAAAQGLKVMALDVIVPDPRFQAFRRDLAAERKGSRYAYGFPNGDGDCNCTTWLERLGVPLLTGNMDEFASLSGFVFYPSRRFGECV